MDDVRKSYDMKLRALGETGEHPSERAKRFYDEATECSANCDAPHKIDNWLKGNKP
jgi:hypothetical protein